MGDDSLVRGNTTAKIVARLREYNPKQLHFVYGCPKVVKPCYWGIDMKTREELIAVRHNGDEKKIAEEVGADSTTFLTREDLEAILRKMNPKIGFCTHCLGGDAPTPITEEEIVKLENERRGANKPTDKDKEPFLLK